MAGRLDEAMSVLSRCIRIAQKAGDVSGFGFLSVVRLHTAFYAGRLMDAEAAARAAMDIYATEDTVFAAAVLVEALTERGDFDAPQRIVDEHDHEHAQPTRFLIGHFAFMARASLRLA